VVDAEALDHALGRLVGDELGDRLLAHATGELPVAIQGFSY
jgi:hypothetical protein